MESRDDCGPPDCQSNVDCDGLWESRHRPWLWVEQTPLVRFKRQKDIAPQVLMATTNGTFGSQPFGFSTGTSGCTNDGKVLAAQKTEFFVAATLENLAGDMARGQGEHLTALATLLGVPTEQQEMFSTLVQERFRELIGRGETSPSALIKALDEAMAGYPVVAKVEAGH